MTFVTEAQDRVTQDEVGEVSRGQSFIQACGAWSGVRALFCVIFKKSMKS